MYPSDPNSSIRLSLKDLAKSNQAAISGVQTKLESLEDHIDAAVGNSLRSATDSQRIIDLIQTITSDFERANTIHEVLSSLSFRAMYFRYEAVEEAHSKTLHCILEEEQPDNIPEVHYLEWLRHSDGIYWISGKAGSRKSTLMKYLSDHERTEQVLREWAGGDSIVIASHFFWSMGDDMQNSQQGLLQTLLFEIFRRCPDLIFKLVPSLRNTTQDSRKYWQPSTQWTRPELMRVLTNIKNQKLWSAKGAVRFCFFIDGLDEYRGDHREICNVLKDLTSGSHIKLCVSSRPWRIFEDALGKDKRAMLALHDLTREDIRLFVEDKFGMDCRYTALEQQEHEHADLVTELTETAQGVFLWVSLIVKELLNGLQNEDTMNDLQRRLKTIPPSLDDYFRRMFEGLDPFYQKKASQIFLLLLHCHKRTAFLRLFVLMVLDYEDPEFCIKAPISPMSESDLEAFASKLRARLYGRCRDLVEIEQESSWDVDPALESTQVRFIHRTVADFLAEDAMRWKLQSNSRLGFEPLNALCKGYLLLLKRLSESQNQSEMTVDSCCFRFVREMLGFALDIEREHERTESAILVELDRTVSTWYNRNGFQCYDYRWTEHYWFTMNPDRLEIDYLYSLTEKYCGLDFMAVLTRVGLTIFVRQQIEANPRLLEGRACRPFLYVVMRFTEDIELLSRLLRQGANPNEETVCKDVEKRPLSVWQVYLVSLLQSLDLETGQASPDLRSSWLAKARLLIDAGAKPRSILFEADLNPGLHSDLDGRKLTTEEVLTTVFGYTEANHLVTLFGNYENNLREPQYKSRLPWWRQFPWLKTKP